MVNGKKPIVASRLKDKIHIHVFFGIIYKFWRIFLTICNSWRYITS